MKRKIKETAICIAAIILLAMGSNSTKDVISQTEEEEELDAVDYSAYLKKIWIVDGWEEGRDYPVSLVIYGCENKNIYGYLKFDENVMPYYCDLKSYGKKYVCPFQGVINDRTALCEYVDSYDKRQGTIQLTFYDNDRIEVELEGNGEKQYLLRPYNISDENFSEELKTIEVELDSWGMVYLAYANYDNVHSIPGVMLINEQGDILYNFSGHYQQGSRVCDVMLEDMNGDGLKDIKVGTTFAQEETEPMFEAFFYQEESGLFYLESYRALVD